MPKTLNQVLGEVLTAEMKVRGLSANALGLKAGLAPNTVGNYMKAAGSDDVITTGDRGKERSAKLAEVEKLALALGVRPLYLLTDPEAPATAGENLGRMFDSLPEGEQKLRLLSQLTKLIFEHQKHAPAESAPPATPAPQTAVSPRGDRYPPLPKPPSSAPAPSPTTAKKPTEKGRVRS